MSPSGEFYEKKHTIMQTYRGPFAEHPLLKDEPIASWYHAFYSPESPLFHTVAVFKPYGTHEQIHLVGLLEASLLKPGAGSLNFPLACDAMSDLSIKAAVQNNCTVLGSGSISEQFKQLGVQVSETCGGFVAVPDLLQHVIGIRSSLSFQRVLTQWELSNNQRFPPAEGLLSTQEYQLRLSVYAAGLARVAREDVPGLDELIPLALS